MAIVKDGAGTGDNDAHGFSAWVDSGGVAHSLYQDGSGNSLHANNVRLFVFAWRNNMGTVTRDANNWWRTKLATGKTLAWAGFETYDAGLAGSAPTNHPGNLSRAAVTSGQITLAAEFNQTTLQPSPAQPASRLSTTGAQRSGETCFSAVPEGFPANDTLLNLLHPHA